MGKKNDHNIQKNTNIDIDKNVMKYGSEAIQLSNISRIRVDKEPEKEYPIWGIIALAVSVFFLWRVEGLRVVACIFAVICVCIIYGIAQYNGQLKRYLIVELNSGNTVFFSAKYENESFLYDAQKAMIKCFNKNNQRTVIKFSECEIINSALGDNGEINNY